MLRRLLQAVPTILRHRRPELRPAAAGPGRRGRGAGRRGRLGDARVHGRSCAQRFGLDQPLYVQLLVYVKSILTLDLGYSFRHDMPVATLILGRLGPTLLLMVTMLVLSVGVGDRCWALAAAHVNRWRDSMISVLALLAYATPVFWAGPDADRACSRSSSAGCRPAAWRRSPPSTRAGRGWSTSPAIWCCRPSPCRCSTSRSTRA